MAAAASPADGSEFDTDTAIAPAGAGAWRAEITPRWSIGAGPNGGYIAAIVCRAVMAESPFEHPLTMTVHYVERPVPGPATVAVESVRTGRSHATFRATLSQERPVAVALATTGRRRSGEPESLQGEAPEYPRPADCISAKGPTVPGMTFRDRFRTRISSADELMFMRTAPGPARTGGWTRLVDGRPLDDLAVPLFMDSWPPPMFSTFLGGGAPTIELTVHWRNPPGDGWHLALFRSRFLIGGYVDEDGELWDEQGRLVAMSRQLARFVPPQAEPG
ncbi:MAG TPA: thioesterase family protein [Acidimicrobiales bacterium]|nr:thioesterase family protein [Acidimicrobiales bacterium]